MWRVHYTWHFFYSLFPRHRCSIETYDFSVVAQTKLEGTLVGVIDQLI